MDADRLKNKDISYEKQLFEYDGKNPKVEYTVFFLDGKILMEPDYD